MGVRAYACWRHDPLEPPKQADGSGLVLGAFNCHGPSGTSPDAPGLRTSVGGYGQNRDLCQCSEMSHERFGSYFPSCAHSCHLAVGTSQTFSSSGSSPFGSGGSVLHVWLSMNASTSLFESGWSGNELVVSQGLRTKSAHPSTCNRRKTISASAARTSAGAPA